MSSKVMHRKLNLSHCKFLLFLSGQHQITIITAELSKQHIDISWMQRTSVDLIKWITESKFATEFSSYDIFLARFHQLEKIWRPHQKPA